MEKRCEVGGMEVDPELKREFEGETHYIHKCLCMITFGIQLEKAIAGGNRLLEESSRSLGLSCFQYISQVSEALMVHWEHIHECDCNVTNHDGTADMFQFANGGQNDNF